MSVDKSHNIEPWLEALSRKAGGAEAPVPEGAWEAVAAKLAAKRLAEQNADKPVPEHNKPIGMPRKQFKPSWARWAAAAVVAGAVASAAIFVANRNDNSLTHKLADNKPTETSIKPIEPGVDIKTDSTDLKNAEIDKGQADKPEATKPSSKQPQITLPHNLGNSSLAGTIAARTTTTTRQPSTQRSAAVYAESDGAARHETEITNEEQAITEDAGMPMMTPAEEPVLMAMAEKSVPKAMPMAKAMPAPQIMSEEAPAEEPADRETPHWLEQAESEEIVAELATPVSDIESNRSALKPWKDYNDRAYRDYIALNRTVSGIVSAEGINEKPKDKHRTMLNLTGGGLLASASGSSMVQGQTRPLMSPAKAPAAPQKEPAAQEKPADYSYNHHLPLTFGIHASHSLYGNLYASLGVNFTYMHSDVTDVASGSSFSQNIKLIGVPFGLKWNFWRWHGLSTYVGGEGLAERVVGARFNGEDVSIKRWQWSVHALAGAQYNFSRRFGVFIEPRVAHYITTMPISTQRDQHTFNFNLQMGLSLDF